MNRRLGHLLAQIGVGRDRISALDDADVTAITSDSRRVVPGSIFVALQGHASDGHAHVAEALAKGARAVIAQVGKSQAASPAIFEVADPRDALAQLLGTFFQHPDRDLAVIAVTGTNGKTTVSHLVRDLLREGGQECGLLGTIRYETPSTSIDAPLTTPAAEDLLSLLAQMRDEHAFAVSMEASSHALDQCRLAGIEVDVAAFTNLTHEHLDYHRTLEAYFAAKLRLLDHLGAVGRHKAPGRAVVNRDADVLAAHTWPASTVFVGQDEACAVQLLHARCDREGIELRARIDGVEVDLSSQLLGRYNVENLLVAAGVAVALGLGAESIAARFPALRPVPGRLEPVVIEGGPLLLIDYAHTPDGIASALQAVHELDAGPVTLVFGCGGDRDRTKRPLMAKAALAGADRVVLTLDNPRTEDPEQIFADTMVGFAGDPARAERVTDRQEALAHALAITPANGVLLVAGKGHETYQIFGTEKHTWDDRVALRQAWSARGGA